MPALDWRNPPYHSPHYSWNGERNKRREIRPGWDQSSRTLPRQEARSRYDLASQMVEFVERDRKPKNPVEAAFCLCAENWRKETVVLSSIQAKIFNPNYQRIIGMGPAALPLIFAELRDRGGHWYWALECITSVNPAENAETLAEQKRAWLDYAIANRYI